MELVANEQKFHPVRELLETLKWDGTPHIKDMLHHFLGVSPDEYSYEVLKLFLLGCIERVYVAGCKFDYMICLVGGQGAGKSSFFRKTAIKDEWFSDDLKKLDDDNVYRKMQGHWIVEMSEMLSIGTVKSTDEIKSFLSRQKETYKDPYDKYAKDRPRQCVFGGTTNRQDFLPFDRTGNRRFLPVMVDMDNAETHILSDEEETNAYILQVLAEAMTIYRNGDYELNSQTIYKMYYMPYKKNVCQMIVWQVLFKCNLRGFVMDGSCDFEVRIHEILNIAWSKFSQPEQKTLEDATLRNIELNEKRDSKTRTKVKSQKPLYPAAVNDPHFFSHTDCLYLLTKVIGILQENYGF